MNEPARDLIIDTLARLRFACSAVGVQPAAVQLDDLAPEVADAFRKQARQDFLELITHTNEARKPQ